MTETDANHTAPDGPDRAAPRALSELVDKGDIVMVMTMVGSEHSSRPMTVLDVDGDRLSFLADRSTPWVAAVAEGRALVHVTLSDVRDNTYLSLNGSASISGDAAAIDRLWNPAAGAYFDGKDDPNLTVLTFDAVGGEYWDSPSGRLGALVALVRAAVDGGDASGDHGPVRAD